MPKTIKIYLSNTLFTELSFDNSGVYNEPGFSPVLREAILKSTHKKQGKGYTNIFILDKPAAVAMVEEMKLQEILTGADPEVIARHRKIKTISDLIEAWLTHQ